MRDILFKAKRIDNGEWVEGNLILTPKADEDFKAIIIPFDDNGEYTEGVNDNDLGFETWYKVDMTTICQYTGLTDKNDNKIWEHDVVRDTEEDMTMVVRWDDEELRFVLDDYGYTGCVMEYGFDEFAVRFDVVDTYGFNDFCKTVDKFVEVIGNIFDNAELSEG